MGWTKVALVDVGHFNWRVIYRRFETKSQPVLAPHRFVGRIVASLLVASVILGPALGIGVVGYHVIARLAWLDALENASMILTGMGPIAPMTTTSAKLFASAYALFSGVVFLSAIGIIMAPLFHRVLHQFHAVDDER